MGKKWLNILLSKEVNVKWNPRVYNYYIKKGYLYTKMGDIFVVKIEDLSQGSMVKVEVLCDYCLEDNKETKITKNYKDYIKQNSKSIIHKDCCKECLPKKVLESNLLIYGIKSPGQNQKSKIKRRNTTFNKYGVYHYSQTDEYKERYKNTCQEKYGVDNVFQDEKIKKKIKEINNDKYGFDYYAKTDECKERRKNTNILKYGVECCFQLDSTKITMIKKYGYDNYAKTDEYKIKYKNTSLLKYGTEHPMQNIKIKEKVHNTYYRNKTGISSKQQKYLCDLLKGELNYPYSRTLLDIAFPEDMIYLEYDGGGHNLNVKLGEITQEEFIKKERNRWHSLNRKGWREIRIISRKDKLPSDEVVFLMVEFAKEYLNSGHSWIHFNINNNLIEYSQFKIKCDFGELRKIKKVS